MGVRVILTRSNGMVALKGLVFSEKSERLSLAGLAAHLILT